ncbi:SNF2-related protein [Teredinibacter waterburyi]|jgi:Superfamily II DNA/RNA helicases, SNF2 family|uniref:SNF2-related protein n=1 Tax=Teredinibacter waterburyi TaxID=1500538 RepID=UPI00165FECAE|nr:SNF2-related protein [Teredinibacter waterburyi]
MIEFVQGQRWVVDSEPELGLGIVTQVAPRTVSIFFPLGDCERQYARREAPLTRIQFTIDDEIDLASGESATVVAAHEHDGLMIYDIGEELVVETKLAAQVSLNQPLVRLLTGQLDAPKWFYFRRQLDESMGRLWRSRLAGLLGARANLIPHQLYVAWMACEREKVRVLLADEVGLGKTIEAGMILTRLLKFERVQRALILVPDSLQVQWLVEMVRKFNLIPSLYSPEGHDFESGQIHIVPHGAVEYLSDELLNADFDITIVDEAHHIAPGSVAFDCLEALSYSSDHLVLLTATPEQLGVDSHFARLKLLDPAKFTSLAELQQQEQNYQELNQQIRDLPGSRADLLARYELSADLSDEEVVDQLLDCHGIGRVMFRNVRSAIRGFCDRVARPELLEGDSWDDKFEWLAQFVKSYPEEKILVITHDYDDVRACESYLWKKHGIDAALFHEHQSLIERDKAAAYFADQDSGSQLLLCSEIGSEGRNFQFSCHLVCLDLPDHPDLLEQRIGRLDRIGQTREVNIHIPFCEGTLDGYRFYWMHEILNCVEQQNPAAGMVHEALLAETTAEEFYTLEGLNHDLTERARRDVAEQQRSIQDGRDALLEMNSCRQPFADELSDRIALFEQESPLALVEMSSDLLQFHFEATQDGCYSLVPSDKMLIGALPGIPPEGVEVTFSREIAGRREDVQFMSWDSPFISGLWELLHHSDLGAASVATLPNPQLPAGHCLLEVCFDVVIQSPYSTACLPFLTSHSVRALVLDVSAKNLAGLLSEESLQNTVEPVKKYLARDVVKSRKTEISAWYKNAEAFAEQDKEVLLKTAAEQAQHYFSGEIARLDNLAKRNSLINPDEVAQLKLRQEGVVNALLNDARLQLSAIRLIVITE